MKASIVTNHNDITREATIESQSLSGYGSVTTNPAKSRVIGQNTNIIM